MPYNGVGVFTRIYQWVQDAANGIFVDATRTDTDSNDIAAGLTNCVTRDGQSPWLANIPAGNFKITGLANGSNTTDSVNYGQVFNSPAFVTPSATTSPPNGDNSLLLATTAFVQQTAFQTALPAQSLGLLYSNGTTASFSQTTTGFALNAVKGADIPSASTINLTTATGEFVHVTGTTGITAITIPVGAERTVVFDGILTLTNSASLILPTGANITTAVGDSMIVRGDTSAARVVSYTRADGRSLVPPGAILLATVTPTAAANLDALNVFTSQFDNYLILLEGILPSAADALRMRAAVAGVAVGTAIYGSAPSSGTTFTFANTEMTLNNGNISNTGSGNSGQIQIANVNSTIVGKMANLNLVGTAAANAINDLRNGYINTTSVLTGVRFFWAGGSNFQAAGVIRIYGYYNS